jgi:hypothetical protein
MHDLTPAVQQIYYATQSGGTTLDVGAGGGNPFASALIELADDPVLPLRDLAARLRRLTDEWSHGHQIVECVGSARRSGWVFRREPTAGLERREALVLVVSDYSGMNLASLWGAAGDARRISAMLAQHGFSVTQGIEPGRGALLAALRSFGRRSRRADVSVIYSTGHGLEVGSEVFLLPGDYPLASGFGRAAMRRNAVAVARMAAAASASAVNLVFFGGCRRHEPTDLDGPTDHAV